MTKKHLLIFFVFGRKKPLWNASFFGTTKTTPSMRCFHTLPTLPHLGSTLGLDFGCGTTSGQRPFHDPQGNHWKISKGWTYFDGILMVDFSAASSILLSLVDANGVSCVIHASIYIYIGIYTVYILKSKTWCNFLQYELPKSPCLCNTPPEKPPWPSSLPEEPWRSATAAKVGYGLYLATTGRMEWNEWNRVLRFFITKVFCGWHLF